MVCTDAPLLAAFLYLFPYHGSLFGVCGFGRGEQVVGGEKQAAACDACNGGMAKPKQPAGRGHPDKQAPPPVQETEGQGEGDEHRAGKNRNPAWDEGIRLEVHSCHEAGDEQGDAADTEEG